MKPVLRRLIPPAYWSLEGGPARLARTFGIAVAVRLVLMPIACHADLVSTYHRSWVLLREREPGFWVPHELIQAAFLALYGPFLRLEELIAYPGDHTASYEFWLRNFAPHPQAVLAIFLFKIPYLLCDLGTAAILLQIFASAPKKGLTAVSLWLFNPIAIFSFYVFSRHDAVAIFFVALCLLGWTRERYLRSAFALGVAAWSRYWPLFVLPFLVISNPGGLRKRLGVFLIALVPLVVFNFVGQLLGPGSSQLATETPILSPSVGMVQSSFARYLVQWKIEMGWAHEIFVFPAAYVALVAFSLISARRRDTLTNFSAFSLCCLSVLYATSFVHPQYFTWFILFLVILRVDARTPVLRNLHYLQIALFIPYTFYWKRPLFGWLLAPVAPEFFFALESPAEWFEDSDSALMLINLARTGMTTVCFFMAGWALFGERDGEVKLGESPT